MYCTKSPPIILLCRTMYILFEIGHFPQFQQNRSFLLLHVHMISGSCADSWTDFNGDIRRNCRERIFRCKKSVPTVYIGLNTMLKDIGMVLP